MCIRDSVVAVRSHEFELQPGDLRDVFEQQCDRAGERAGFGVGVGTVSYTHLDVYKRQCRRRPRRPVRFGLRDRGHPAGRARDLRGVRRALSLSLIHI